MIKSFRKERDTHFLHSEVTHLENYEVVVIDLENGNFEQFNYSVIQHKKMKYTLTLTPYKTNTFKMGYEQPKEWLKRAKELLYQEFRFTELEDLPEWDAEILKRKVS